MAGITSNNAARLQNNIQKPINEIKKLIEKGSKLGEINNFYVEEIGLQIDKIQKVLDNMEY